MNTLTACIGGAAAILVLAVSCSRDNHVGKPLSSGLPQLTVTEAIDPGRIGKAVQVRGTVLQVCQEEGCWMSITDGKNGLRITFEGSAFVVPMDVEGAVIVEGTVQEEVFEQEDARAITETMGWSEEQVKSIQGDTRLPVMVATGVRLSDG